tara:strand:- start:3162 stop:3407 length:246 start_codon:yes stop_codon:yes gene_type:complete
MYTTEYCPYCERARQLLNHKNIAFDEIRVDNDPQKREEMISKSQRHTVPQIFINGKAIGGCDDLYALEASGKLDTLRLTEE